MKAEFPFIEGLSTEISAGLPMVYAAVASMDTKVPIALVSDGVSKFLSMLLGVEAFSGGLVLVDEIENGFYYDRLPKVWAALLLACKHSGTQVFASTHSAECLRGLLPTLRDHADEFSLIRAEKVDGRCTARMFTGRELRSAIEQDMEIR